MTKTTRPEDWRPVTEADLLAAWEQEKRRRAARHQRRVEQVAPYTFLVTEPVRKPRRS